MSQSHPLSDDQVAGELRKMTAFILQEALEKSKEIQIKADEEFAIEKSKLVRQETSAMDIQYEKKLKQASMSQQITRSTMANKTRLKVLSARQELLDELFERASQQLRGVVEDKARYQSICKDLVLEGLYALGESNVEIRAKQTDFDVVQKSIERACEEYKAATGRDIIIALDRTDPLPADSYGGVIIVGGNGKIDINNTFEERLRLLQTEALPSFRTTLFGKNANRKFYD